MLGIGSSLSSSKHKRRLAWLCCGAVLVVAGIVVTYEEFWRPNVGPAISTGAIIQNGDNNTGTIINSTGHDIGNVIEKGAQDTGHAIEKPFDKGGALSIDKPFDKGGSLSIDKGTQDIAGGPNSEIRNPLAAIRALGASVAALPKGDIVLNAPTEMKVGDKRQVDANVGINVPMDVLQKKSKGANQQIKGQAHISSEMIATLSGPGFKIDAITTETQRIAEGFPTVWSWNVEAKESGDQELEAVLYALVSNGDTTSRQRVNSFTQKIAVSVREKTLDEWLKSVGNEIDAVKAIAVTLGGIVTVVVGWFGITSVRQKNNGGATWARKPKQKAE
jgi:hypothetical protein